MIPMLAIMLAVYASARLALELCRLYPGDVGARRMTWFIALGSAAVLWFVAFLVIATSAGFDPSTLR